MLRSPDSTTSSLKAGFFNFKEKWSAGITTVPPLLQQSHLPGLDGLRGISIIIVLLNHITKDTFPILLKLNVNRYTIICLLMILLFPVIFLFAIILSNRLLIRIGVLSYSLYIWQQLFTYNQPWQNAFKYSDSIILNLIRLFAVSRISYYFYEKKFLTLKNRFK